MTAIIPANTHSSGDGGHTTDHNNMADVLSLLARALAQTYSTASSSDATNIAALQAALTGSDLSGVINVGHHGAALDGVTDDTNAIQTVLNNAAPGTTVFQPGTAGISGPLTIPAGVHYRGAFGGKNVETGVSLSLLSGFAGDSAVTFPDGSAGQRIENVTIDASNVSADSVAAGIRAYQIQVEHVVLDHVLVFGYGFHHGVHVVSGSGKIPLGWRSEFVNARHCSGDGFRISGATDMNWQFCQAIGNSGNGWYFISMPNSVLVACRADWNGGYGYQITSYTGSIIFEGCLTDRNTNNGVNISGNTGKAPIQFNGLKMSRDGSNGTSAAIRINNADIKVQITNLSIDVGVNDDGRTGNPSPAVGVEILGTNYFTSLNGAFIHAVAIPLSGSPDSLQDVATQTGYPALSPITLQPNSR